MNITKGKYFFDSNKLLWHMDRVDKHYRQGQRIYPLHIDVGVTKACNAKCCYCYGIFQQMTGEIIEYKTLVRLFRDAPFLGIRSLTVTGDGEPTLNPGIYDALKIGKQGGLNIGFATNGIALDTNKTQTILSSCTWLRFNLSAIEDESYKTIHGVSQCKRVQDNIREAVWLKQEYDYPCTIGLQMVLIPDCLDQVIPEAEWAVREGIDYFVIKQFSAPGCNEMSKFNLDWYDNPETLEILKQAESLSTQETKIIPKWNTIASKGMRPYEHCVDTPLIFQISGNSKCYPCGYLFGNEKYCYGDLKKQSLKEILDSEHYWKLIKYMQEKFNVQTDCQGCCRHDSTNKFIWDYIHPPEHINFI